MSAEAQAAVMAASITPAATKLVAVVYAWHANSDTGEAWPSMATVAAEASLSERHAKRAVAQLKSLGILLPVRPSRGGNRRSTTTYVLDLAELARRTADRHPTGDAGAPRAPVSSLKASPDTSDAGVTPPAPIEAGQASERDTQPRAPASPEGVRRRHEPRAPASPKRDERRPKVSLSSKAPRLPSAGDAANGRASSTAAVARGAAGASQRAAEAKQPPSVNSAGQTSTRLALVEHPSVWANDDEKLSRTGDALGMGSLADATQRGVSRVDYMRNAIAAWGKRRREESEARKAARRGAH